MSNRAIALALAFLALGGAIALLCDTAMLWDGAFQFCVSLITGQAFSYLSRFHSWAVWQPMMFLARHGAGLTLLKLAYGAPYCFAPLLGAAASWWVVRKRARHLMIWALFGVCLAPLPGQIFMINDSIFQLHLFWPVFLAALVPGLSVRQVLAIGVLSLFQLSHPMGIALCLMTAGSAAILGWRGIAHERRASFAWAGWNLALAVGGVAKLLLWPDPYAKQEASWAQVVNTYQGGVRGWPLVGVEWAWVAAALLVAALLFRREDLSKRAGQAAVFALCLAGVSWLAIAVDYQGWQGAVNFRRWVAPASGPLFLAIFLESWRLRVRRVESPLSPTASQWRSRAGIIAALVFLFVLGTESIGTGLLFARLKHEVAAEPSPWIRRSALPWVNGNALSHWGLAAQVLVAQGREPHTLLWQDESTAQGDPTTGAPGGLELGCGPPIVLSKYPDAWFQWHQLPAPPPPPARR